MNSFSYFSVLEMKWWKSEIIFALFLSTAFGLSTANAAENEVSRLPKTSRPINYNLTISTNVQTGSRIVEGNETIDIEILGYTNVITLHVHGLIIDSLLLRDSDNNIMAIDFFIDAQNDFLHIGSDRTFQALERLRLEINFRGTLRLDMKGFYRSTYTVGSQTRLDVADKILSTILFIEEIRQISGSDTVRTHTRTQRFRLL